MESAAAMRFNTVAAPQLARNLSTIAWLSGLSTFGEHDTPGGYEEPIEATRRHIDRVDLCPAQLEETFRAHGGTVRHAYMEGVVPAAQRLLGK